MLKVNIVAVGKIKEKYFQEAVLEYQKRLSKFCNFKIIEVKEENFVTEPNEAEKLAILKREGALISKELKGYVIAMAIEGKKYSSVDFSSLIDKIKNQEGEITFVIGGSYGIDEEVKQKSKLKFSFSDMTFPHTLARVMLVEQLYRAFTISVDGKYHK